MPATSVGKEWTQNVQQAILDCDAELMQETHHPGMTYVMNDHVTEGASKFAEKQTWEKIFSKVGQQKQLKSKATEK